MIEAVNSAIANSSLVRNVAEQGTSARSPTVQNIVAQTSSISPPIVLAPYISPFVYVDNQFNKAVLQIRDSQTGEVQRQFPSEETLRNREAAEAIIEAPVSRELSQPNTSASQTTLQSATLFAASQIGSEAAPPQISVPSVAPSVSPSVPSTVSAAPSPSVNVAQAQIASAALSAAAQGGQATSTVSTSA